MSRGTPWDGVPIDVPNNSTHQSTINQDHNENYSTLVAGSAQRLRELRVDGDERERHVRNRVGCQMGA